MTAATCKSRTSRFRVVFDGQSMNLQPSLIDGYPAAAMSGLHAPYTNPSIGGSSWTQLANGTYNSSGIKVEAAATRSFPPLAVADKAILVMNGGFSDINYELDSGATVLADEKSYADAARVAGADYVICLTLCKWGTITGPKDTERIAHNTALMADVSGKFDYVVDVANNGTCKRISGGVATVLAAPNNTLLTDPTNATYFEQVNQLHWTAAGCVQVAAMTAPAFTDIGVW